VRRLVEAPSGERPVHGRLSPDKVLLQGGGRVVLLDLDQACQGPPARDAGTLIGHLERAVVMGELAPERAAWAAEAVLTGYDRTASRPLRRRDVTLHTAVALLDLAMRPFRRLLPSWPDLTVALLDRAEQILVHTAVALLDLAMRPFRRLLPSWPDLTVALLDRAEQILAA
jgi:hypothetical protein